MTDEDKPKEDPPKEDPPKEDTSEEGLEVNEPEKKEKSAQDLVDDAKETAGRLEKANEDLKETLDRQEKLRVEDTLAGKSVTSQEQKIETDIEYKNRIMSGEEPDGERT